MAKKEKTKFITPDILKTSIIGAFQKLDPRYMIKNPVMFVVEIGFIITLILTFFPTMFGGNAEYRIYNGIVTVILFVTVLFANFAESVAEGRGKAQAASLKKTKQDTKARVLLSNDQEDQGQYDQKRVQGNLIWRFLSGCTFYKRNHLIQKRFTRLSNNFYFQPVRYYSSSTCYRGKISAGFSCYRSRFSCNSRFVYRSDSFNNLTVIGDYLSHFYKNNIAFLDRKSVV